MNNLMNFLTQYGSIIFVILLVVGPVIFNAIKQAGQAAKQARDRAQASQGPPGYDELAAQRREQMRGESPNPRRPTPTPTRRPSAADGAEPGNLTMAERIARARAKAQYEARATGLRQSPSRPSAPDPDEIPIEILDDGASGPTPEDRRIAEARDQAERRRQAQEIQARRQREAAAARRQAASRSQRSAQAAQLQAQRELERQAQLVERQREAEREARAQAEAARSTRRRAARPARRSRATASVAGVRLTQRTMRSAVILREILDPPVAMRPPGQGQGHA